MKYIIEQRVNPSDGWKPCKKFKNKQRAEQSLETLRKNASTWTVINSAYLMYRLVEQ